MHLVLCPADVRSHYRVPDEGRLQAQLMGSLQDRGEIRSDVTDQCTLWGSSGGLKLWKAGKWGKRAPEDWGLERMVETTIWSYID